MVNQPDHSYLQLGRLAAAALLFIIVLFFPRAVAEKPVIAVVAGWCIDAGW